MLIQKKAKAIMLGDTPIKKVMLGDRQIRPEVCPAPTNLVGVAGTLKATLTWTSATGESGVTWTEEKLVRKEGSAPQGSMDGTTVATITTKDTYSSTGYEDTGLDSTKTYYYKVFAMYDNGTEKGSTDITVTPLSPIEAGIYHSATLGLITITDGNGNEITIADKNLGATQVYNKGDTLSEANCGKYFQRGNNYGFPFTGAVTTSSSQVDASTYGPGNYYSSSTFITGNFDWSNVKNNNLWGDTTNTLIARKGPCDSGFHVPTKNDWDNLISLATSIGIEQKGEVYTNLLKLPLSGRRYYTGGGSSEQNISGGYLTSTPVGDAVYMLNINANIVGTNYGLIHRATGESIRPFKNEVVAPDNTWTVLRTGLPSGYQKVEYLESTGTQFFNTDMRIEQGFRMVLKINFRNNNTRRSLGGHYANSVDARLFFGAGPTGRWSWGFGSTYGNPSGAERNVQVNVDYEIDFTAINGNQICKVNGTTLKTNNLTWTQTSGHLLRVFASTQPDGTNDIWGASRVYSCQIYDANGVLKHSYVPCYRKSDGKTGFFDNLDKSFNPSIGTNDFIPGPDVN